jgi:hypothetical protein
MIKFKNISRYRAASTHLAISASIAAIVLLIMLAMWYPPPLFIAMGGGELALLIIGIDVIIGPLITLIIFDTRKKELIFDLAVVAALQLGALGYGTFAMYSGRPAFTVFAEHQFAVVSAAEIDKDELAKAPIEEFRHFSLSGPRLVATNLPTDANELSSIAMLSLGGLGIQHMPKYYVPYAGKREQVLKASRPLAKLDLKQDEKEKLQKYLRRSGRKIEELQCLPVSTRNGLLTALIDARSGDLLDMLDIRPNLR